MSDVGAESLDNYEECDHAPASCMIEFRNRALSDDAVDVLASDGIGFAARSNIHNCFV